MRSRLETLIITMLLSAVFLSSTANATVSITTQRVQYNCNGSTTTYAYPFEIAEDDDLIVIKATNNTETTLVLNTDYTVTGAGGISGGNVVLTAGSTCASGYTLTVLRAIELTQDSDYVDGEAFSAESLENDLDRQILINQDLEEKVQRTPKLAKSSAYVANNYTFPDPSASKIIGWNSGATDLTTYSTTSGSTVSIATMYQIGDYANLDAAITAIGASEVTLLIDEATAIVDNVQVQSGTNLWFTKGGSVTIPSGKTLTIASPANIMAQPNQQIFVGAGTVSFSLLGTVLPGWWGMSANSSAATNAAAFNAAIATGCDIKIPQGNYSITAGVVDINNANQEVRGESRNSTILTVSGAGYGVQISASEVVLERLYIQGGASTTYGVYLANGATLCTLRDLEIVGVQGGWGIANEDQAYSLLIDRVITWQCSGGIKLIKRADNSVISNSLIIAGNSATSLTGIHLGDDTVGIAMVAIDGTDVEGWADRNIYVSGVAPLVMSGVYSEAHYDANSRDLEVGGASYPSRVIITGFYANGNAVASHNITLGYNCQLLIHGSYLSGTTTGVVQWSGVTAASAIVEAYRTFGTYWPNQQISHGKSFVGSTQELDELDMTVSQTKTVAGGNAWTNSITYIDSSGGVAEIALPDGHYVGQEKIVAMSDASNPSTLTVNHHVTSDPEVLGFAALTSFWLGRWTGTDWMTIQSVDVTTP